MDTAANLLGLVGVALLAFPAFYAAKYGSLIVQVKNIDPVDVRLKETHERAIKRLADHQGEWRPALSWCLRIGTLFAGASYLIMLMKAIFVA